MLQVGEFLDFGPDGRAHARYADPHAPEGSDHYIHPITGERLTRVTTVLDATEGKPGLPPWSAGLTARYAVEHLEEVTRLAAEKGPEAAIKLLKDQARLMRQLKADTGSYVHKVVEALILWAAHRGESGAAIVLPDLPEHLVGADYDDDPLEEVVDAMVMGFITFVTKFDPVILYAEMNVFHRGLGVAGTLDMIIRLEGWRLTRDGRLRRSPGNILVICVDVKTGRHLGSTVDEQLAAYRRMREALLPLGLLIAMPRTDAGAVLHLRPSHVDNYRFMPISEADDMEGWNQFRGAIKLRAGRVARGKPGHVARPLRPDGSEQPALLADLDCEGYGRVPGVLQKVAGLADVEEVAAWTAEELRGVTGIGPKSIEVIRRMLADHGLHLAGEAPEDGHDNADDADVRGVA